MFFHSSAWCRVLSESYGYKPIYFTGWESDELRAVVPMMEVDSILTGRRGVSLPFTDFCEPLLAKDSSLEPLLSEIRDYGQKRAWKYVEFRGGERLLNAKRPSNSFFGHRLDLATGIESLEKGMRDSTRRNTRKAAKAGVTVEINESPEAMKEFYRLNCITRRRHGLPPQPFVFFEKFFEHVINPGLGTIVLASFDDNIIAAAIYVVTSSSGGSVLYKYGASDKAHQRLRANNMVMWAAIKFFAGKGHSEMLLGRTDNEDPGLRQFKTGWGVQEHLIYYYTYDMKSSTVTNGCKAATNNSFGTKAFRYTPIPILRLVGNVMYRHFG